MLKKMSIKKIVTSSIVLLLVALLYFIPTSHFEKTNIPSEIEYVSQDIKTHTIYLLDNNNYVSKTSVRIRSTEPEDIAQELLETMIQEGKNSDQIPSGFQPLIHSNTNIHAISLTDGIMKVDVSSDFLDIAKELEESLIEAVTYTLTSIDGVKYIILYVDGEILTQLPQSKIKLPATLSRDIGINKRYELTSLKNVTSTTIYYVHQYNDEFSYTPVTLINNDSRDKIEIIIDELSSSTLENPLMSFLNSKTNLVDYAIEDDRFLVCFDEYIFDNLDSKDILEEVLYTISLSIYDNYDVEEVLFEVDGQQITKTTLKSLE